ncbi:SDR family oxidoreductase [Paenibacillus sp. 19GGS1-52]|uniref:SDR family oxidoreductase n=1 Tax=Paenibacillus sp. 19GGS1-52 TaxID=2758563 RepID=UPI001EFB49CA|nr:SDR family oxidoreductase [Paenibacillus sp. 19GGS1-52]ULO09460.1 SDR family oxidoreductase [Paenibacillus sp. 19GGS1-52]
MGITNEAVLVTGASGHLGREAVEWLLENHKGQIIAVTRNPLTLSDFSARGVVVRQADFDQPHTLDEAFVGAKRLLLISTDAVSVPGQRLQQHSNAVEAAIKAGVEHIVYTSVPNPEPGTECLIAPDHYGTEEKIKSSGLSFTILRNNLYADNLLPSLQQAAASGQYAAATGDGLTAYVTRKDCARAAAAALASSFTGTRTIDVTGTEALSGADVAQIASEVIGKSIQFVALTTEQLVGIFESIGMPNGVAQIFASFDTASAKGEYAVATTTVQELTGQAPASLKEFLTENLAAFTSAS